MTDYLGQQLGNYRLLRLLGRGGFAEVYLGEHVRLGMKAAVKLLHTNLIGAEIEAFQREAYVIANLGHPNIVRVLDFDVQRGTPFLVLDYAPNGSLREKHPRGMVVPLELVTQYVQQVSSALQYAHDHKVIHRDVKPENMLVGKQGEIVLGDFGIASVAHSTSSMSTQASMGTLAFMAPEQIQGLPRKESDQYALAVTVYQWLSGELPFQGSSTEIIAQHLAVAPPPLRSKAPHISATVEQVVMTALAKDPQKRFASIQTFAAALDQAHRLGQVERGVSLNAPTVTPALSPTLPASPPSSAPPVLLSPEPAASSIPAVPLNTPIPKQIAHTSNARGVPLPPYPPLPQASLAGPPRKMKPWHIWLILSLIITLVGSIAAIAIPAMIVYGPHSGSSGNTDPSLNQSSVGDVSNCRVGSEVGMLFKRGSSFPRGTDVELLCDAPSNAFGFTPDQAKLVGRSSGVVISGDILTAESYQSGAQRELDTIDTYTWTVFNASNSTQIASIQFTVTESLVSQNVGPHIDHCQVGTGYDTNSGTVQGAGSSFSVGTTIYLACFPPTPSDTPPSHQSYADKLFGKSSGLIDTGYRDNTPGAQGNFDDSNNVYYNSVKLTKADRYSWVVFCGAPEVWVDFQVR